MPTKKEKINPQRKKTLHSSEICSQLFFHGLLSLLQTEGANNLHKTWGVYNCWAVISGNNSLTILNLELLKVDRQNYSNGDDYWWKNKNHLQQILAKEPCKVAI